jgi:8-hydroxy-5-deazaflavin:NADPH oxidoreductase
LKITILGTGNIGGTLGKKWMDAGHEVRFGARDPQKAEVKALLESLGGKASAMSIADAIALGEAIVFAIPGSAMDETVAEHAKALDGKWVVDTTNKVGSATMNSFAAFAKHTPHATVYRAFNIYGWENFRDADFAGERASLFYCGPDNTHRPEMEKLIAAVGLDPVYVGGAEQVDVVDNLVRLWFALARGRNLGRTLALKMLVKR